MKKMKKKIFERKPDNGNCITCRKCPDIGLFRDGCQPFTGDGIEEGTFAQFIETISRTLFEAPGETGKTGLDGV